MAPVPIAPRKLRHSGALQINQSIFIRCARTHTDRGT